MAKMKISAISDVHVKRPHDEADQLLCRFLDHPLIQSSQVVALLGDIFDLMCGPHQEYLQDYDHIFSRLERLKSSGKRIIFSEGNHDVHLEKLFSLRWPKNDIVPVQDKVLMEIEGKSYYFSHGDEHEVENISYQKYKRTILSPPLRFVANHLMPYQFLKFVGERASQKSRKKGSKLFDAEKVREEFRRGVQITTKGEYDFILGGHSHVQDMFHFSGSTYLNNGYALKSGTFIFIENHIPRFEKLM
jgi:UDP-2,3-diacylglucosamine hydrolase